jgi:hypothetical protein
MEKMFPVNRQGPWRVRAVPSVTSGIHSKTVLRLSVDPSGPGNYVTFLLLPCQDYQLDSSSLLASPLLKRFTWTESKPKASLKIE